MGESLVISSGKGGVGKTTIAANLGIALSEVGLNVLIFDADITMANLELIFGMEGLPKTIQDVLEDKAKPEDIIYDGPGGVKVVPAGLSLRRLKKSDPDKINQIFKLFVDKVDLLIIDGPPGLEVDAVTSIAASQNMLLVVNPEITSLSDALKIKLVAEKLGTRIMGVIVNRVRGDPTEVSGPEIEAILELRIIGNIPEDQIVKKSTTLGKPFVLLDPKSPASLAIKEIAKKIAGKKPEFEHSTKSMNKLMGGLFGR